MKNIVILFDGTWNTSDSQFPSNVVKTAQLIAPRNGAGVEQVVHYDSGVGSVDVAVASNFNNLLGGAFGSGLLGNIEQAYRFLAFNYAPGDRLFIFGFSRGAFSARSMGGLIRTCGILRKDRIGKVKEAIQLYKRRVPEDAAPPGSPARQATSRADADRFLEFRRENSIAAASSNADRRWRISNVGPSAASEPELAIDYMGVWDTVGSLGIPSGIGVASLYNRRYRFHDLDLSSMVKSARHALAIDERRATFEATLWENIDALNRRASEADPQLAGPPYRQQWFPGDHGSVGGSGDVNGHWQASLVWVVEGAMEKSLGVDEEALAAYRDGIDVTASLSCMQTWSFSLASIALRKWRKGPGPGEVAAVSGHARSRVLAEPERLAEKAPYRPKPLVAVLPALLGTADGHGAA